MQQLPRQAEESGRDLLGGLGIGFVNTAQVQIVETGKIERPLAFVTIGKPSDKLNKVMEAFKAAGK